MEIPFFGENIVDAIGIFRATQMTKTPSENLEGIYTDAFINTKWIPRRRLHIMESI
jgi:hypothetical protein